VHHVCCMKTTLIVRIKQFAKSPIVTACGVSITSVFFWWMPVYAIAQVTEMGVPVTTTSDITAQELDLKQKQLELEKAKLELQKSEALELQKAKLELEIKTLELAKARRDLMVKETQERLDMQVQGDVLFDTGKSVVKAGAVPTLRQVAMILLEYPKGKVIVTGYADSTGTEAVNLKLSRDRAEAVKTYLLDKSGVSSERVLARGMGEEKPAATNMTEEGRQLNRRVEISVSKLVAE
jgi:outer membrane protein OmpA-like peptidoglycan-associated protein